MKHFYICVAIFLSIITASLFTDNMLKKELDIISVSAEKTATAVSRQAETEIKVMKERFYDKKNMLMLFASKEHIKDLETDILLMEDAVQSEDITAAKENSINIQINCAYIKRGLTAFD